MKTPYKNIYGVLKLNRFVVLAVVLVSGLTTCVAVLAVVKLHKDSLNKAFMINTEGHVIPLKLAEQREHQKVELLSHLEQFHRYFYHLDASNFEKHLDKALWLGDSSVDALYKQKRADGVYNRLLQYSLIQKVLRIESIIQTQTEPYTFRTTTVFEINRGSVVDTYRLETSGNLVHVDRHFPNNPHGLLITNYFENKLQKLEAFTNE
ncbi:conjugal transfer protein TraK [Tamlana fucoidanivorans]|uniref:Conjugal transfer protein TraK n=1 Tax=Allotamlana fucoidanivorans TaxID=2583814 RepID=A0A5C4SR81_9FLAO|nr:conjugal transfer protein TraK [Tamlana fucoidanivorans]TNJ46069.1 conjugal transfer protein TraK [Tamlana fucoidanivorans]